MSMKKALEPLSFKAFLLVREAGLEVAVPNSINFLMLNYVINSSESVLLYTTQSINFMLCDSVKGQICGQQVNY